MISFMVVPASRHGRLGTEADFPEMFSLFFLSLGTEEAILKSRYKGFKGYEVRLGTGSLL